MMLPSSVTMTVFCLLLATLVASLAAEKQVYQNLRKRIINGKPMPDWSTHPYAVSLYKPGVFLCGGVLINPTWVLTAAHCTYKLTDVRILAGTNDLRWMGLWRHAVGVYNHPGFKGNNDEDIALLKLNKPIFLNESHIGYAKLPWRYAFDPEYNNSKMPAPGDTCVFMGWGRQHPKSKNDKNILQEIRMKILPPCSPTYYNNLEDVVEFCSIDAGEPDPELGYKSTCSGDSGSPVMCGPNFDILAGLVSRGPRCNPNRKIIDIHTRVSTFLGWMLKVMTTGINQNCRNDCP